MSSAIFALVPVEHKANLDLVFRAIKPDYGRTTFTRTLCAIDSSATDQTEPTAYCMYDASALMSDAVTYAAAQGGTLPTLNDAGNAIAWGEKGIISTADAIVAFATMQFWVNASDVVPLTFAQANMTAAGLQFVPDPPL